MEAEVMGAAMKRMAHVAIVILSSIAGPLSAAGAEQGKFFMNLGAGTDSCGGWTKGREIAGKANGIPAATQANLDRVHRESWVMGYITALNSWYLPEDRGGARNLSEGTDPDGLFAWIDNYCAAHPLDNREDASQKLAIELRDKWYAAHPVRK